MTGLSLPEIGLGTAHATGPQVISQALEIGYRFLDTAQLYGTDDGRPMESVVGEALAETSIPRDELVEIAEKYDATAAQVSLAWLAGLEGVIPIPGVEDSSEHLEENLARIRSIDRERRYYPHPFEKTPPEYRPAE